jgi:hypothetical protein
MSIEQITPLTERERWLMIEAYLAGMMAKKRPKPHTSPHSTALDWLEENKDALSKKAEVYDNGN